MVNFGTFYLFSRFLPLYLLTARTALNVVAMKLELLLFLWGISFCGAVDGDEVDDTGCPKEFYGKCHCGKERYKYWGDGQKLMIVNCTNTNFNSKIPM